LCFCQAKACQPSQREGTDSRDEHGFSFTKIDRLHIVTEAPRD
jgi:hypothetical protein